MTIKEIQKIIKDFEDSILTELELEFNEIKLRLSKNKGGKQFSNKIVDISTSEDELVVNPNLNLPKDQVKSPLVGTFYEASSPEAKPFISVGDKVEVGQVICIIEAMKIMNEITSNISGIVDTIHVNNGDVVGFDDPIITVNTDVSTFK